MSYPPRYYGEKDLHFLTTSTYRRTQIFNSERFKREFVATLAELRAQLGFRLLGYVLMPEHFHLLLWPSPDANPSQIMQRLKGRAARSMLKTLRQERRHAWCARMLKQFTLPATVHDEASCRVWQRRFYDMNIWSEKKQLEKLDYMHNNPWSESWSARRVTGRGHAGGIISWRTNRSSQWTGCHDDRQKRPASRDRRLDKARICATRQFYATHVNALGSSTANTDSTGAEVGYKLFYPWGQRWLTQGTGGYEFSSFDFENPPSDLGPTLFRTYIPGYGRWLTPDPTGGDVTNPQSLNRYAYVTNNPASLTDPLGLDSSNPADPCSELGFYYRHAECGGPPPGSDCGQYDNGTCYGDPTAAPCIVLNIPCGGGGGGGYGGIGSGGSAPGAPPAGQPPLAGALGASCGPFGCYGGFGFQEEETGFTIYELVRLLARAGGAGLGYLLTHSAELQAYARWCIQTRTCSAATKLGKVIYNSAPDAARAAANDAFGCLDAPCIQRALQNIQQQQMNGTWRTGASPASAARSTTVVTTAQPTTITVTPNPKSVVPAGP